MAAVAVLGADLVFADELLRLYGPRAPAGSVPGPHPHRVALAQLHSLHHATLHLHPHLNTIISIIIIIFILLTSPALNHAGSLQSLASSSYPVMREPPSLRGAAHCMSKWSVSQSRISAI